MELRLTSTPFDASYVPADHTRLSTNFANLAKDPRGRSERIAAALALIESRFHRASGDTDGIDRYRIALDILTVGIRFGDGPADWFPMTETLRCRIHDLQQDCWLPGPIGCNYSSYVRDYDFNVVLPRIRAGTATDEEVASFGALHGLLFRLQFRRFHPSGVFDEPLVIAISVSSGRTYRRTGSAHPLLGLEYLPEQGESITSGYFAKMGLGVSYFMPPGSRAPLAFYHEPNDLLGRDRPCLAALIAVMDTFESIYRPEIYRARSSAGDIFKPDLLNPDHDPPPAVYDRVERDNVLGRRQAELAREAFLEPNAAALSRLVAEHGRRVSG